MMQEARARCTLEFKQELVRLVEQTRFNWVKAKREGRLKSADSRLKISAVQMEISRLQAELARAKMKP